MKIPKLTDQDDIVAYLTMFERLMEAYEVKAERWPYKLASVLTGKAQQAYNVYSHGNCRCWKLSQIERSSFATLFPRKATDREFGV